MTASRPTSLPRRVTTAAVAVATVLLAGAGCASEGDAGDADVDPATAVVEYRFTDMEALLATE